MSVISEVQRIKTNISNACTLLTNSGIYISDNKKLNNLADAVDGLLPFVPTACNGLCFWLDGDCNTRNGLDRSKKYMENLMWSRPLTETIGNREHTAYYKDNVWVDNFLRLNEGYAYYPQPYCTATNEYTVEVVVKVLQTFSNDSQVIMSFGSGTRGSFHVYVSVDNVVYIYFKDLNNVDHSFFPNSRKIELNQSIYAYFRIRTNTIDCGYPGLNAYKSLNAHPTGHNEAFSCGLNVSTSSSSSIPTNPTRHAYGNVAVGMIRFWSKALSDEEIRLNYRDAKNRFNCI